ncbi:MAG: type VI secretion system tip protein TssI/VgrG [bacterium]
MNENRDAAGMGATEYVTVRFESPAFSGEDVHLRRLSGHEAMSKPFDYELYLLARDYGAVDPQALLDNSATLVFQRGDDDGGARLVHGMIASVDDCFECEWGFTGYRVRFVPRVWRLSLHETLDIFMDLNVPGIVAKVLKAAGFQEKLDFEFRLMGKYPVRDFVVQYKETDLNFISRLTEHLGITFFFEHRDGRDAIVFADGNIAFKAIGEESAVLYNRGETAQGVFALEARTQAVPSKVVVRDYNYRNPSLDVMAEELVPEGRDGQVVEYGVHCKDPEEAAVLAKVRAQEISAGRRVFRGESHEHRFAPGFIFTLEEGPGGDTPLLLTEVRNTAVQSVFQHTDGAEAPYTNDFRAIAKTTTYRPPRVTPKPRVHGTITGIVEPSDNQQYADIDDRGRYRVKFLFDTAAPGERKASKPVRMAQPSAGPGYGIHFPLRPFTEVLVTCVDGDPDRPIIAGAVPNPQTDSPVVADNSRKNVIRTGGANEIEIDDSEGSERIKMTTPHGNTVLQLGAPNAANAGGTLSTTQHLALGGGLGVNVVGGFTNYWALVDTKWGSCIYSNARDANTAELVAAGASLIGSVSGITKAAFAWTAEAKKARVGNARACWDAKKARDDAQAGQARKDAILAAYPSEAELDQMLADAEAAKSAAEAALLTANALGAQTRATPVNSEDIAAALALDPIAYPNASSISALQAAAQRLKAFADGPSPDFGSDAYSDLRAEFVAAACALEDESGQALRGTPENPGGALAAQLAAGSALEDFIASNTKIDENGNAVLPDLSRPEYAPLLRAFNTATAEYSRASKAVNDLSSAHLAAEQLESSVLRNEAAREGDLDDAECNVRQAETALAAAEANILAIESLRNSRAAAQEEANEAAAAATKAQADWEEANTDGKCDAILADDDLDEDDEIAEGEADVERNDSVLATWDLVNWGITDAAGSLFAVWVNWKAYLERAKLRNAANAYWLAGKPKGSLFATAATGSAPKEFKASTDAPACATCALPKPPPGAAHEGWPEQLGVAKGLRLPVPFESEVADGRNWHIVGSTHNVSVQADERAQIASKFHTLVTGGVQVAVTAGQQLSVTSKGKAELFAKSELVLTSPNKIDIRVEGAATPPNAGTVRISAGDNVILLENEAGLEKIELNHKSKLTVQLSEAGLVITMGTATQSITINDAKDVTVNSSQADGTINLNATGAGGKINLVADKADAKISLAAAAGEISLSAKKVAITGTESATFTANTLEVLGSQIALKQGVAALEATQTVMGDKLAANAAAIEESAATIAAQRAALAQLSSDLQALVFL